MRQSFLQVETEEEARDEAPWAAVVIEVEGGFRAFESLADYETWTKQQ